jgi:hypothetical protein
MTSPQWMQTLAKIAPSIAAAASGPFAGIVGPVVAGALGMVVHSDDPNAPKSLDALQVLQQKITEGSLSADQIVAMKKADQDFQRDMAQKGFDLQKLAVDDVEDARKREIAIKDSTPRNLAYILVLGFLGTCSVVIASMIFFPEQVAKVPGTAWGLIGTIIGYLLNESGRPLNYYYGTTQGNESSTSNDVLKQLGAGVK